jgi:hypothetical protein
MAYETLALGITLTLPTSGTKNWATTLKNTTWTKISQHSHTGSGDGNKLGTNSLQSNIVNQSLLAKNLALNVAATLTPSGTTQTIDFNNGNIQNLDLSSATGTVTLTLSNPIAGAWYTIWVTQGGTFRDLTWPASVKWPQGVAPILTQTASAVDLVQLYYTGTVYRGLWELNFT